MSTCSLCDLPTPDPPVTGPDVDGTFCCPGCMEVARAVDEDPALSQSELSNPEERTGDDVPEGASDVYLAVEGMHCTTCEAFLDARGSSVSGIYDVDANYGLETARVAYDPDRIDPGAIPDALSGYGYTLRERGADGDAEAAARRRHGDTVGRLLVGGFLTMLIMQWYIFYLYPEYLGMEGGILRLDATTPVTIYLPLVIVAILTTVVLW